jgi:membrane-associated protease RseP (regulator of RpoE activity)
MALERRRQISTLGANYKRTDMRRLMLTIGVVFFFGLAPALSAAPRHSGGTQYSGGSQSFRPGSASAGVHIGSPSVSSFGAPLSGRALLLIASRTNGAFIVGYGYPALSGRVAPPYISEGAPPDALPGLGGLSPAVPNPGLAIPSAPLTAGPLSGDGPGVALPEQIGMRIINVIDGGAAKKADLRQNDVILGVEDRRVNSFEELQSALAQATGEVNIIFINGENGKLERLPVTPINGKIGVAVAPIHLK